jgi:small-conductance mechanosensitive channel
MQAHEFDGPSLDTPLRPRGKSRLFLEDDPSISVEDDGPISVRPSAVRQTFSASAVLLFLFVVVVGAGGALAWWYYGDQATAMVRAWPLPGATSKPTAPPDGFAEFQQQLKSITADLAAVRQTLEQQSAANHDQLTRIQEQIAQQSLALQATKQELSERLSTQTEKAAHAPPPKPAQHPASHVSKQDLSKPTDLSKPIQVAPPQSLLPPKQ